MWALSHSDWPLTGHSDFSIDEQTHSKRSHLNSVNWSPFGFVLVIFHSLGCMQPMTTLHTHSIPLWGMHLLSLATKDRYLVSINPVTDHSKTTFHIQMYLSHQFWPSIFHPDFWAQHNKYPAVTPEHQSLDAEPQHAITMHNPTANQPWCYWLSFLSHVQ